MPTLVCTGATLRCSFGSTPSTFSASGARVTATGAAGVVTDVSPGNVAPFGLCASLANPQVAAASSGGPLVPQPCQPVLAPWTPGASGAAIGAVPALDDSSQCQCVWGGVVDVGSPGQAQVTVS